MCDKCSVKCVTERDDWKETKIYLSLYKIRCFVERLLLTSERDRNQSGVRFTSSNSQGQLHTDEIVVACWAGIWLR